MAGEVLAGAFMRVLGRRKCATCNLYSCSGWCNDDGSKRYSKKDWKKWNKKNKNKNDSWGEGQEWEGDWNSREDWSGYDGWEQDPPEQQDSYLMMGLKFVVRAPLVVGVAAGSAAWRMTKKVAITSVIGPVGAGAVTVLSAGGQATYVGGCMAVNSATALFNIFMLASAGAMSTAMVTKEVQDCDAQQSHGEVVMTQEIFDSPWEVIVDAKRKGQNAGQIRIGDPVEIREATCDTDDTHEDDDADGEDNEADGEGNDAEGVADEDECTWRKGVVKERKADGVYVVQDLETEQLEYVTVGYLRLDMARVKAVG